MRTAPLFVVVFFLGLASTPLPGQRSEDTEPTRRLNVLFLFADDQRPDAIGAHGNPHVETPAIDRLVRSGMTFRRNYCMGSQHGAVCQPSRAMLMSGRPFHRVPMNLKDVPTLPEAFAQAGYRTFGTGKWHNGAPAFLRSFQQGRQVMLGGMSDHFEVPVQDVVRGGGAFTKRSKGKKHSSELFADAAIDFLETHTTEEPETPFFAYVAFTAPHDPRDAPPAYRARYARKPVPLPGNFLPQHPFNNGHMVLRDEVLAAWPRQPEVIRDQLREYYALVTHMDAQIDRILNVLDARDLTKDTLIVYAADHGLAVGSHGLLGKQNLYEHSMGCPLVFTGPGVPAGKSSEALTYLLDIFPTLTTLCGVSAPAKLFGHDLTPVLLGEVAQVRNTLYTSYAKVQRAVRDQRYKLIRYPKIARTQLFDLQEDPLEKSDLSGAPENARRISTMMAELRRWQQAAGDTLPLTAATPQPDALDLSGKERKADRHQPKWIVEKYFNE